MTSASGVTTDVALKVLLREAGGDGQAARRMRDEGRLLARLHHPGIVQVHDLVELDGRLALVTELVDGRDLGACLYGPDPIPLRALLEVVARTAEALDAAWNGTDGPEGGPLRLVHRDVKPSNILVSRHGDVRLLDFGLARTDEVSREAHTRTDLLVGSPAYMAPERYLERAERSASDVFSLGATLFEGLTHTRLLDLPLTMAASFAVAPARFAAHVDERFAGLAAPPSVVELVRALLAFDPNARPTAADTAIRCDDLAATMDGPSLATWCRERGWEEVEGTGSWTGRTLEEDSSTTAAPLAPVPARGRNTPLLAAATVGALLVLVAACAGAAAVAWWWPRTRQDLAIQPLPVPMLRPWPETAPQPAALHEAVPEQASETVPAVFEQLPPVVPKPRSVPKPEPAPEAPPPAPASARILVDANVEGAEVTLRGEAGTFHPPASVPPGHYAVMIELPDGRPVEIPLDAVAGETHTIRCNGTRLINCAVETAPN
jgi:serine/threonine-protein kinase